MPGFFMGAWVSNNLAVGASLAARYSSRRKGVFANSAPMLVTAFSPIDVRDCLQTE